MEYIQDLYYRRRFGNVEDFCVKSPMVHIIIPTHNRVVALKRAIESILWQSYEAVQIYVINCGSTDGTSEMIRADFGFADSLYEINVDSSVWWTEAMSIGVARVLSKCGDDDVILSFNDDASFSDQEGLSRLIDTQRNLGRSLVIASCLAEGAKRFISSGYKIDWGTGRRVDSVDILAFSDGEQRDGVVPLDIIFGRGVIIPVRCFREAGNYNAMDFPQYGGDAEFSFRVQQAGWKCFLDKRATVVTALDTTPELAPLCKGFKAFFQALRSPFSINSPKQISKGFKLIDLCCPPRYRVRNKVKYLLVSLGYTYRQCLKVWS